MRYKRDARAKKALRKAMKMAQYLYYLIPLALLGVVVALTLGLGSFLQDGPEARRRSNRMMQWRVALQFVALVIMMAFLWLKAS